MRVFVTGAGGFIGSRVVSQLQKDGHDVAVLSRPTSNLSRLEASRNLVRIPVTHSGLELTDQEIAPLKQFSPDAFIHLAWAGVGNGARNDSSQLENIGMTRAMVELAARLGAQHFVGLGSQAEYGPCEGAIAENQGLEPTTLYGAAKASAFLVAGALCKLKEVEFSWIRVFSTYGPGDEPYWMVQQVARDLLAGETPKLTRGSQKWDYLYVDDAAKAIALVATNCEGVGAVNLGSGTAVTIREIVEVIRDKVNPSIPLVFGQVPFRPDQVMHLEADISKLSTAIKWQPEVSLTKGLENTVSRLRGELAG